MGFEKDLAKEVLEAEWPDHPKSVNSHSLINLTKELLIPSILMPAKIPDAKFKTMSIVDCYKYRHENGIGFLGELYFGEKRLDDGGLAREIEQQTEIGKNWLEATYKVNIILLKKYYK